MSPPRDDRSWDVFWFGLQLTLGMSAGFLVLLAPLAAIAWLLW